LTENLRLVRIAFLTKRLVVIKVSLSSTPEGACVHGGKDSPVFAATLPSCVSSASTGLGRRGGNLYQILAFCRLTVLQVDLMVGKNPPLVEIFNVQT